MTALVLGYGGGGAPGEGGGGPLFSIEADGEEGPDRVQLVVETNRSDFRVGDAVAITVLAGDRPVADATVTVGGRTYRTGSDGTVVHEFRNGGTHRITADRIGNESVVYRDARTELRVRRTVERLTVLTNVSRAVAGDPVAVTVTGPDGAPVAATVRAGGRTVETSPGSPAVVRFDGAGNYTVDAERPPTNTTRYRADPTTVAVERRTVGLSVVANASRVTVGERVALMVVRRDTGEPVNASVGVGGDRRWTGEDGRVVVSFDRSQTATVTASVPKTEAERFRSVGRVVVVESRTVRLELSVADPRPERDQPLTVTLRRADTGRPVSGELRVGTERHDVGENGTVRVRFDRPGERLLRGFKRDTPDERYRSAYSRISVRGPYVRISGLEAPDRAEAGEQFPVVVSVYNGGNEAETANVTVRLDDGATATHQVRLTPGEVRQVTVPVSMPNGSDPVRVTVTTPDDEATTEVAFPSGDGRSRAVPARATDRAPRGLIVEDATRRLVKRSRRR